MLMEDLLKEMNRARELKKLYQDIPTGFIGASLIQLDIDAAERAIADDDVVKMLVCYKKLRDLK